MKEIKDLNVNDRIIIWRYNDMNIDEGHNATVIRRVVRHAEPQAVVVQLDGVSNEATITDKDYFDTLPLSNRKSEDYENENKYTKAAKNLRAVFGNKQSNVNHPSHYNKGKIEVIEIMEELPSEYGVKTAICLGNVIKYVFRAPFKNGVEDLRKAKWYLERAIKNYEEEKNGRAK